MSLLKCACLFNSLCEVRFIPRAVLFVIRVLRICCYFYLSKEGGCFAEAQHDNGVIPGNARGSSINLRVTKLNAQHDREIVTQPIGVLNIKSA